MARIIITLTKEEVGNILLGGEVQIPLCVTRHHNLQDIIVKCDEYSEQVKEED